MLSFLLLHSQEHSLSLRIGAGLPPTLEIAQAISANVNVFHPHQFPPFNRVKPYSIALNYCMYVCTKSRV